MNKFLKQLDHKAEKFKSKRGSQQILPKFLGLCCLVILHVLNLLHNSYQIIWDLVDLKIKQTLHVYCLLLYLVIGFCTENLYIMKCLQKENEIILIVYLKEVSCNIVMKPQINVAHSFMN